MFSYVFRGAESESKAKMEIQTGKFSLSIFEYCFVIRNQEKTFTYSQAQKRRLELSIRNIFSYEF